MGSSWVPNAGSVWNEKVKTISWFPQHQEDGWEKTVDGGGEEMPQWGSAGCTNLRPRVQISGIYTKPGEVGEMGEEESPAACGPAKLVNTAASSTEGTLSQTRRKARTYGGCPLIGTAAPARLPPTPTPCPSTQQRVDGLDCLVFFPKSTPKSFHQCCRWITVRDLCFICS